MIITLFRKNWADTRGGSPHCWKHLGHCKVENKGSSITQTVFHLKWGALWASIKKILYLRLLQTEVHNIPLSHAVITQHKYWSYTSKPLTQGRRTMNINTVFPLAVVFCITNRRWGVGSGCKCTLQEAGLHTDNVARGSNWHLLKYRGGARVCHCCRQMAS